MKTRIVYTVIREARQAYEGVDPVGLAKEEFKAILDEPAEYLYGVTTSHETIGVALQVSKDGKNWEIVEEQAPQ